MRNLLLLVALTASLFFAGSAAAEDDQTAITEAEASQSCAAADQATARQRELVAERICHRLRAELSGFKAKFFGFAQCTFNKSYAESAARYTEESELYDLARDGIEKAADNIFSVRDMMSKNNEMAKVFNLLHCSRGMKFPQMKQYLADFIVRHRGEKYVRSEYLTYDMSRAREAIDLLHDAQEEDIHDMVQVMLEEIKLGNEQLRAGPVK